jgi:hypothetical protein
MSGWEYFAEILGGLFALFVCVLSVMKLVSLACKALRDVRESWLRREQSQLMRMVRSGRAGL